MSGKLPVQLLTEDRRGSRVPDDLLVVSLLRGENPLIVELLLLQHPLIVPLLLLDDLSLPLRRIGRRAASVLLPPAVMIPFAITVPIDETRRWQGRGVSGRCLVSSRSCITGWRPVAGGVVSCVTVIVQASAVGIRT